MRTSAVNKKIHFPLLLGALFIILNLTSCSIFRSAKIDAKVDGAKAEALNALVETDKGFLPEEEFNSALQDKKAGHTEEAVFKLKKVKEESPNTVWARRASFLLSVISVEAGGGDEEYFRNAQRLADIDEYLLFYKAMAFINKKEFPQGISSLDSLLTAYPDSALRPDALYKKAYAHKEAENPDEARKVFNQFIADYPEDILVPDALLEIARASFKLNEPLEAMKAIRVILTRYPAHIDAKAAETLTYEMKSTGVQIAEPSPEERFNRGRRLFSASRYADSIVEFSQLTKNSPYRDRAIIKLAAAFMRLKRYDRAEKILKDYLDETDGGPKEELDALYLLSQIALRQGKEDDLLNVEKKLARRFPKSAERGRTLLFIGRFYGPANPEKSMAAYKKTLDEFKDTGIALDALWEMGWLAYRSGRFEEALARFSSYGEFECKDASKFLYWSGRSAEKTGNTKEAADFYGKLCGGFNDTYYCRMAEERLTALAKAVRLDEATLPAKPLLAVVDPVEPVQYSQTGLYGLEAPVLEPPLAPLKVFTDRHYLAAKELLALGLPLKASKEINFITERYSGEPREIFELARALINAGDYYNALRISSLYLSGERALACGKGLTDVLALGFPAQVVELIRQTDPNTWDPYLVAAVMREESSFNPRAISTTGALGLMQIMPSTGRVLAKEFGKDDFDSEDLFDPRTNIQFGSRYLNELTRRFNNNAILAIAGYNAGPEAASRWKKSFPVEPDEFIESIPYLETRKYTKRVLKSYADYLKLSGIPNPFERIIKYNAPGDININ